ncbi:MAG TPA: type I-C CRISPR-associated protein Cas8c/Csd1 [Chthoniobacterales bacterium]
MMLQALVSYAERRITEDSDFFDPDFRWEKAAWRIEITRDGKLGGLIPLKTKVGNRWEEKRVRRPHTDVNEISVRSLVKAKSYFLCDTVERVFRYEGPNAVSTDPLILARAAFFRGLIKKAADLRVASALLQPLANFLGEEAEMNEVRRQLTDADASPQENVVFGIEGVDVITHPEVVEFWRQQRQSTSSRNEEKAVCLVTGQLADCVQTANKIKGIGGQDTILISANEAAFCSFGLEKAQNSAISIRAEGLAKAALDDLIARSRAQHLVFNQTFHLHWTREPVAFDPMDLLGSADENAVEALLKSVQHGQQVHGLDANAYYALSLSGNGARIVVRDWLESTVPEVERHIAEWFSDLAIVQLDGLGTKRDFKFGALLYAMVREELDELPPQIPTQLLHGALRGRTVPLPQTALAAALRRQQLDQDDKLRPARLAVIKACLLRSSNKSTINKTMTESLNAEIRDPAYLCGRLFAVFDRLQYLALGGVNAGVVERYYASASVTPSLVMGRLFRNAQFHLAKAEGGTAENVRKDFETISSALGDHFPPTLDLEAQGRFALGYYHQKADYRRRTAERKEAAAKSENSN